MSDVAEDVRTDLRRSMINLFKVTTILEMRRFNTDSSFSPTYKEVLYMYGIGSMEKCTATDLVKMFNISKETMSIALSKMEKKGFIERTVDPEDNRRQFITIADDRFIELNSQSMIYEQAKKKILAKYTQKDLELASKVIYDLAEEMNRVDMAMPVSESESKK